MHKFSDMKYVDIGHVLPEKQNQQEALYLYK
jgi:hypothetical protein